MQSLQVSAKTYSGCYGGETANIGDLITVNLVCPQCSPSLEKKQILFAVDKSGSMCRTMPSVKVSLFAARNALLRILGIDVAQMESTALDAIFTRCCTASIITFSNTARCEWNSEAACAAASLPPATTTFTQAINSLESENATNLSDALTLAFQKKLPGYATWIILLTDGKPTKGACQTVEAFTSAMRQLPPETKIIPLGYTTDFDPEILSVLGTMTYLDGEEAIAETLGSIMGEIVTCYGVNARIFLPAPSQPMVNSDDIIVIPDVIDTPRDIIGSQIIGCIYSERKYLYGHLPWGNKLNPSISQYHGLTGHISYFDIARRIPVTVPFTIENGEETIPDDVCEGYFESSKGRIILDIYNRRKYNELTRDYIDSVKAKIADWKHPRAAVHKEEILRLLAVKPENRGAYIAAMGMATSAQHQIAYTNVGRHTTFTQRLASQSASQHFRTTYSEQPPLREAGFIRNQSLQSAGSSQEITIDPRLLSNTQQ